MFVNAFTCTVALKILTQSVFLLKKTETPLMMISLRLFYLESQSATFNNLITVEVTVYLAVEYEPVLYPLFPCFGLFMVVIRTVRSPPPDFISMTPLPSLLLWLAPLLAIKCDTAN
jgi:hypothetical protein